MHTRKGVSQKDLVRGKTKLLLKKCRYPGLGAPRTNKRLLNFFIETCEAEKGGLTGRRSSRKVVSVP